MRRTPRRTDKRRRRALAIVLHEPSRRPRRADLVPPRRWVRGGASPRLCKRLSTALRKVSDSERRWDMVEAMGTIRQRKRGDEITFYLDFRPYGRLWSHDGVAIRDEKSAAKLLKKIQAKVAQGRELPSVLADYLDAEAAPNRVSTWLAKWMEVMRAKAEAGQRSPTYLRSLESYAREGGDFDWWVSRSVFDITKPTLAAWRDHMLTKRDPRLSPKSTYNTLGAFRSFVTWLTEDQGILRGAPAFPTVELDEHAPVIITWETQQAILQQIPEERRGAFLAMALGIRPGEVRAMDVGDYADGWLTVSKAAKGPVSSSPIRGTKTRNVRRVPVTEELRAWLEQRVAAVSPAERLRGPAPLFSNPGASNRTGRWTAGALRKEWKKATDAVGVTVSLYEGTKHSFATDALLRGVPERTLQALLGHREAKSTRRYAQLADGALVDAIRRPRTKES